MLGKWYSAAMKSAILNRDFNRSRLMAITLLIFCHRLSIPIFKRLSPYYDLSPSGARVLLIVFAKSFARLPEMVHATATSCGWTPNRNYPCGLISLIAMGETLNNFRAIAFNVNQDISSSMQTLAKANLPPLLSVPVGEKAKSAGRQPGCHRVLAKFPVVDVRYPTMDNMPIESRLYS